MKINLNGSFEENRKKLNDALGIDHEDQNRQINDIRNPKNLIFLDLETGKEVDIKNIIIKDED